MPNRKKMEVCILSDTHLGTYGCHAEELYVYLNSIDPKLLILNGDIIDIWNFRKKYFPASHMRVIRAIMKMVEMGTKVVYITGNHDETLRQYSELKIGDFKLADKYIFYLDGKSYWVFHGDVFDSTTKGYAKMIAKLGGKGYDLLILFNRFVNNLLLFMGKERRSFSKKIKNGVKHAVKWINNFEKTAAELAIEQDFDYVICGHIHQPVIRTVSADGGSTIYMNSGDWVENLTALEYMDGDWSVYRYPINDDVTLRDKIKKEEESNSNVFEELMLDVMKQKVLAATV